MLRLFLAACMTCFTPTHLLEALVGAGDTGLLCCLLTAAHKCRSEWPTMVCFARANHLAMLFKSWIAA